MLKRGVAVLVALVVGTVVIYGGVTLYRLRHDLFRPDAERDGATEVTFDLKDKADDADMQRACEVLRLRLDEGGAGVTVRRDGARRVAVVVPKSRRHDAAVSQARRVAGERGATDFRSLAHAHFDKDALAAAGKAFLAMKGEPVAPGGPGDGLVVGVGPLEKRYRWARLSEGMGRGWVRRHGGSVFRPGAADRWVHSEAVGQLPLYCVERGPGAISYFVLTLEPDEGARLGFGDVRKATVVDRGGGDSTRLEVTLDQLAAGRVRVLTGTRDRKVVCVVDGVVVGELDHYQMRGGKLGLYLFALPGDADDVASLVRGGEMPVKLDPASAKEHEVAPKR